MDKKESREILERELAYYRAKTYTELLPLLDNKVALTVTAPSGQTYNIVIDAVWDSKNEPYDDLRVCGLIDDGGWRTFVSPLCVDFIMRPDGSFVDE